MNHLLASVYLGARIRTQSYDYSVVVAGFLVHIEPGNISVDS